MNYHNDISGHACTWLENLVKAGALPYGVVDCKPIQDINTDLSQYMQCHFFAGLGGWPLALKLAGWPIDVEVWTGSPPCQPFSSAGLRKGIEDERHIAPVWLDLIREYRPSVIFGEQVATAVHKDGWLDTLFDSLEQEGYSCGSATLTAVGAGAPHKRNRLYFTAIAAHPQRHEQSRKESCRREIGRMGREQQSVPWDTTWQDALARLRTVDDGIPRNVAGTDAARNAIVPQVGVQWIRTVMEYLAQ